MLEDESVLSVVICLGDLEKDHRGTGRLHLEVDRGKGRVVAPIMDDIPPVIKQEYEFQ